MVILNDKDLSIADDDECVECDAILEELETVDDEADAYGIDFVKNNDAHAARQYNIYNTPALVRFMTTVYFSFSIRILSSGLLPPHVPGRL